MHCKWKKIWKSHHGADLTKDRSSFAQQQSPSFMSAVYDRTVRTNSYNDFVMKIDGFTGAIRSQNGNADVVFSLHTSGLLNPSQEAVDDILQAQMDIELPEMMTMALEFFENSRIASTLCATLLQIIDEASDECRRMEVLLADLPHSGEALGFMQQCLMVESLSEMVKAKNPFAEIEASEKFADVGKRYGDFSGAVEARRRVVVRKVRGIRRWRGGCIAVVLAVLVGATVVAVVVATHAAVTMATVPVIAVAAFVRSKSMNGRNSRPRSECRVEGLSRRISMRGECAAEMESAALCATTKGVELEEGARGYEVGAATGNTKPKSGQIRSRMGGSSTGTGDAPMRENFEGAGTSRDVKEDTGIEMSRSIDAEADKSAGVEADMAGSRAAEGVGGAEISSIGAGGVRTGAGGLEEVGGGAENAHGGSGNAEGVAGGGGQHTGAEMGGRRGAGWGGEDKQCWCWGSGMLTRQSAKLDALARGSFTVNRMLDTLRCLVTGLQDDVERNRKLVEFGWRHREEAKCVQQVGKQLFRSHSHMVQQLANLQEQVVVCFLIINKARDIVLQEFSPSPLKT